MTSCGDKYICKSRGKFRNMNISPLVGDMVEFDSDNNYILEIFSRKNELIRPPVSNIDQAFVVTSVKNPDFSSNLLNKLLTVIEYNNITPIICFTKLDLLSDAELKDIENIISYYESIGYKVLKNTEIHEIRSLFQNKVSVFTGQSGAGKSTLLNHLDSRLNIETAEISYALGRGKHTTRHVELLEIENGLVADTPGFSSLSLDITPDRLACIYPGFSRFVECKYRGCKHDKEVACKIKDDVNNNIIMKEIHKHA
jgi:ribosome biogenesis GTPase